MKQGHGYTNHPRHKNDANLLSLDMPVSISWKSSEKQMAMPFLAAVLFSNPPKNEKAKMPLKLQKIVTNDYCLSFWAKIMARSNTMAPLCAQADDRTIWPHQRVSFCSSQVEKNSVFFNRMIHVTILCSHLKAICSGPGFQNWTVSFSVLLPEMLTACTGAAWTSCHTHPQWKLMWKWSKRTGSPDKSSTF